MFQASTTPTRPTDTLTKSSAIMVDVETRYVFEPHFRVRLNVAASPSAACNQQLGSAWERT